MVLVELTYQCSIYYSEALNLQFVSSDWLFDLVFISSMLHLDDISPQTAILSTTLLLLNQIWSKVCGSQSHHVGRPRDL